MSIETPNQALSSNENNTSEQAIIITPTAGETRDSIHPDRKKSILEKLDTPVKQILAFLAIAGVAGGAGVGGLKVVEGMADNSHSSDKQPNATGPTVAGQEVTNQPTAEAHPNVSPSNLGPLETAAPTQEVSPSASAAERLANPLEISATLSPEQQAKTLVEERLGKWEMAGATPENQDKWISATDTLGYLNELASNNSKSYAEALFAPGWETHEDLSNYIHATESNNASSVENFFKTYKSYNTQDQEPYTSSMSVEKTNVVNQAADSVTFKIQATEHNNAAKNRVATLDPNTLKINGNKILITATLKTIDGVQKISELKIVNDPTQ